MPQLYEAITKIRVSGKNVKDIPGNPFTIKRIISSKMVPEPVSIKTQLNVDTYVSPISSGTQTFTEKAKQMAGMLDSSKYSEWAPWSPISRLMRK